MQKPQPQSVPYVGDIESRQGMRSAFRSVWDFLRQFFEADNRFKLEVYHELAPLYGELDYTPSLLANGAQTAVDIAVADAQPGYCADVSYDQDLQGLQMTWYVRTAGTVRVVLQNGTGAGVTLAAGRFRAYVWPRLLTS